MKVCATPGCPTIIQRGAYRGLCDTHRKQRDRDRGSKTQRGYDTNYMQTRRAYQRRMDAGEPFTCWRCGKPINPNNWHLGHSDQNRNIIRGPECPHCNLSAAGKASRG